MNWRDLSPSRVTSFQTLAGNDLKATNTFQQPNQVVPRKLDLPKAGQKMTVELPPRAYSVLTLTL